MEPDTEERENTMKTVTLTALEILNQHELDVESKLSMVLQDNLIESNLLHEFACRCAERTLSYTDNPDPRSVAAIEAKRAWLREEISDDELEAAQNATWDADYAAACAAACDAVWAAAWTADYAAAKSTAYETERKWQIEELKKMLSESEDKGNERS